MSKPKEIVSCCLKCRHMKSKKPAQQPGDRAPKRKIKYTCPIKRMNVTSSKMVHCSDFKSMRGRPSK